MKTKLFYLFTVAIFIFLLPKANANHILGGDLTYVNVGPNQYKFTLTVYRDCAGNQLDNAYTLNYKSATCKPTASSFVVSKVGAPEEVSISCPSRPNTCNGGSEIGIQRQVYTGTVTLPSACTDWVISWDPGETSKRNENIKNIKDAVLQNFYLEAKINNAAVNNNNSPTFSGMAFSYLFSNQLGTINSTATDVDGNELKYKLITPKTGANTTVTYNTGFTANSPVSTSTTATFNTNTGDLSLTPTKVETSVTAVVVEEYKNGVLIGSVMRDLQIITLDVKNANPILSGINNTSSDSIKVCAGDDANFDIYGSDSDIPTQNLTVTWNNGITLSPGNGFDGFTTKGTKGKDTTTFKWKTPSNANGLYTFTVKLTDDNCPLVGATTKTYKIRVYPKPLFNLGNDTTINCTAKKTLLPKNLTGKSPYKYLWSNGALTPSIVAEPGTYSLTVTDANNCSFTDDISIRSGIVANFKYDSLCANSPTNFTDLSFSKSFSKITKWDWDFGDPGSGINNTSLLKNPSHQFPEEGDFIVKLKVEDEFGCKGDTSLKLHICDKPMPDFQILDTCKRKTAPFRDLTEIKGCGIKSYIMTFTHQDTKKVESTTYNFTSYTPGKPIRETLSNWKPSNFGVYDVKMVAINENGCRNSIEKSVNIRPQPIIHLKEKDYFYKCNRPDTILHIVDTATVKSKLPLGISTWEPLKITWSKNGEVIGFNTLTKNVSGTGIYSASVTDIFGCDSIESVKVIYPINTKISNSIYCYEGEKVKFYDYTVSNWTVLTREWLFGDGNSKITSGTDTSQLNVSHLYASDNTYNVKLKVTDEYGCTDTTSKNVLINTLQNTFSAIPNPVCINDPVKFKSRTGAYIDTLYWTYGDGGKTKVSQSGMTQTNGKYFYEGNHAYSNYGTGKYNVIVRTMYNKQGCNFYDTVTINLYPELKVDLASPVGLCANLPTQLNATRVGGNPITSWSWDIYYQSSKPPFAKSKIDSVKVPVTDEISKTLNGQTRTFTKGGNYFIDLKVTNADGCKYDIDQQLFRILDLPVPTYCTPDSCVDTPIKFKLFCNGKPEVSMNKFEWDFGDGTYENSTDTTSHIYKSVGNFPVTVTISDTNYRCSKTSVDTIHLKSVAFPAFAADTVCHKLNTSFYDKTITIPGDTIIKWVWKFGDGDSSYFANPTHKYNAPGTYNVNLSVTNKGKNCTKDYTYPVVVRPNPTAGFTYDELNSTAQRVIVFTDASSNDVVNWLYDFGDGTGTSTNENPVHTYQKAGIYVMKQEVKNQYGCKDLYIKDIDLNIYFLFPDGFTPNGDGLNDKFFPILRGIETIEEIKLYNRWGELIWESSGDLNASWDGKYHGEDQPMGVYVYYARAKSFLGDDIKVQGKVTIIR